MKLRRLLKEKLARGHVELTLNLERGGSEGFALNRELVGGYIAGVSRRGKRVRPFFRTGPQRHSSNSRRA